VSSRGTTYRVRILGSRLGQTMVTFDGRAPKHVDLGRPTDSSCS
jgi:hypothetical protein